MATERDDHDSAPVLIDSCVLLDVMLDDATWVGWSAAALAEAADAGSMVINPIVYAEVSAAYTTVEEVDELLPASAYRREPLPFRAGFLAGKAFVSYRRRGGLKRSPLPDFYIGAHAAVHGYRLLTRDPTGFRSYFPTLDLIAPATS